MEAKLIVVSGKANKGEVALNLPTVIGRSRDVKLTVAHPMISRQHCEVYEVDGLLMIRDLGSLNGTVVKGQRISEAPLCPGDELTVGPLTFRAEYEYEGDLDSVPPAKLAEETTPLVPGAAEVPDFSFVEASDDEQVAEIPDFEAMAAEAVVEPLADETEDEQVEEIEIIDEIDEIDEVEEIETAGEAEEEEPEPAPPPAAKKTPPAPKPSKQAARPAAPKSAKKPRKPRSEKQADAAKQAGPHKGGDVAAGSDDDELDDFLKAL